MKIEIITEMGIRQLKIMLNEGEEGQAESGAAVLPEYEYNILETVKINGLANISKQLIDGNIYIIIPIYSYISLEEKLEKDSLDIDMFKELFKQLLAVWEKIQVYLLDGKSICLNPRYIFYDEQEEQYIFLPIDNEAISILEKFEQLFTFFVDICPIEEKELLGFIFESFNILGNDSFEPIAFMKYLICYDFSMEPESSPVLMDTVVVDGDANEDFEEENYEKTKSIGIVSISVFLLVFAFCLTYLLSYEFKYSAVSIAATFLAVGLMAFQVFKTIKGLHKIPKV